MKIDLRPDYIELVQNILRKHLPEDAKVYVFGSRAKWTAKEFSDIDLAVDVGGKKLPKKVMNELKADFEESKLPYKVDVVDLNDITPEFRKIIKKDNVLFGFKDPSVSRSGEWARMTLGELCEETGGNIQTGPFGSQLHAADYVPMGIPSIMPQNIGDNRVSTKEIARITEQDAQRLSRYLLRAGDIVYSRRGDVERRALITENEDGWLCGTGCLRVRFGNKKPVDPAFVSYYLGRPETRAWITQHAVGATMPNLNTQILSSVPVLVPPIEEQKSIARILSSLEGKIELNRRMNATLEATAQALFKSWFIDFDPVVAKAEGRKPEGMDSATAALFPDSFTDSPLGSIPQGWKEKPFSELIDLIGGGTPKTSVDEYWNGNIPWFSVVDAPAETDVFVINTEKKITKAGVENSSTKILPVGTTIISARGTVGRVALVGVPMAMNQSCYGIRGKNGIGDYTTYFSVRRNVADLQTRAHGSVFDTITRDTFKTFNFIQPPVAIMEKFEQFVSPIMKRILSQNIQSATLMSLRDELLPRLISGKLQVKHVGEAIGATA